MREVKVGISYCVRRTDKPMYLGKMGTWYSDIRLAAVYASPQAARMAAGRISNGPDTDVYEVQLELLEKVEATGGGEDDDEIDSNPASPGAGVSISVPNGPKAPAAPAKIAAPPAPDKVTQPGKGKATAAA